MKVINKSLPVMTCLAALVFACAAASGSFAQDCVEECPDDPGANVLQLAPAEGSACVQPGQQVVVELRQKDLAQCVVGYQAFIAFDPACLQVESVDPTDEPYGLVLRNEHDNTAGTIDLMAGIPFGGDPTCDDALLATITFTSLDECCPTIVCFRTGTLSQFSDENGLPVQPCLKFARVTIDGTPPTIICPPDDDAAECGEVPPPVFEGGVVIDDCDPDATWFWLGDEESGTGCEDDPLIIRRSYQAIDCAGNVSEICVQVFTAVDRTPPTCTPPDDAFYQCPGDVPPPDPSLVQCEDNCDPNPVVEWVGDEQRGSGCPGDPLIITRTYRCTDRCGLASECEQTIYVMDTTPPVITPPTFDADPVRVDENCAATVCFSATVTDNCGVDPEDVDVSITVNDDCATVGQAQITKEQLDPYTVRITGCAPVSDLICCPATVQVDITGNDTCGNSATRTGTVAVIDDIPPTAECPPDQQLQCDGGSLPAPDPSLVVAGDNCDPDPLVEWGGDTDNGGLGCPGDPLVVTRTYSVTDDCGNVTNCEQVFTIADEYPPEITCPPDLELQCVDDVPPFTPEGFYEAGGSLVDTCDPNPELILVDERSNGGSGCPNDPLVITRTYSGRDVCGNEVPEACVWTITVVDDTPPEWVDGCPPDMVVYPDARECDASVNVPPPAAQDNCTAEPVVTGIRDDGRDLGERFSPGETRIFWIATDDCGNQNVCIQRITVKEENLLEAYVELQGVFPGPVSRCINFELWTGDISTASAEQVIDFTTQTDRSVGTYELQVPCGVYDCMTAQDRLHTLRSTASLQIVEYVDDQDGSTRTKYRAEYKDEDVEGETGHWLVGGNFDNCQNPDDTCVDILDFGVFSGEWGKHYDSDGDQQDDGNTTCPACGMFPHADANGDGVVTAADLSSIAANILKCNEGGCGDGADPAASPRAVMRISVAELIRKGWGNMAAGDLNGDGWLDTRDIEEFAKGARPKPVVEPGGAGEFVPPVP